MKVLVTGASGFVGSHVVEQLAERGDEVRCLVRTTSNIRFLQQLSSTFPSKVELVYGAVENRESLDRALEDVQAVVHAAGLVKARGPEAFFEINVQGTQNLLEATMHHAAPDFKRFVLVSSLAAVGPSHNGKPVTVDATSPVTHYGRSKQGAEEAVVACANKVPSVILRPPMIYGPRDGESFAFFKTVSRGILPKLGRGDNTMSVIYAADAASACLAAIEAKVPSGAAFFIDDGRIYIWRDMLTDIEHALGKNAIWRLGVPLLVLRAAATASETFGKMTNRPVMLTRDKLNELSAPHWVCQNDEACTALGWKPEVQWPEGTRRASAWYKKNGWL